MSFAIAFESEPMLNADLQSLEARGYLLIGEHRESFIASQHFWGKSDYEKHWKKALSRILEGESRSCLITSLYDPATANFIEWWPIYGRRGSILVQNHLLFLADLKEEFDIDDPFRFVPDHSAVSEDGERISEWIVSLDAVRKFIAR